MDLHSNIVVRLSQSIINLKESRHWPVIPHSVRELVIAVLEEILWKDCTEQDMSDLDVLADRLESLGEGGSVEIRKIVAERRREILESWLAAHRALGLGEVTEDKEK